MPSCSPKVHGSGHSIPHGHVHHSNTTCAPSSCEKPGCLPTEARQKPTRSSKSENRHQCWRTDYTTWGDYRRTQGFLPNPDTSTRFLRRPPQQLSLCRRLAGGGGCNPQNLTFLQIVQVSSPRETTLVVKTGVEGWGRLFETVVRCNLLSIYVCLSPSFWPSLTRSPCSCCFAFFPPFSSRNSTRTRALALASNQPACARPADEGVSIATCWWGPKILRSDDAPDFSKSAIFFTNKIADGADVFLEACFHFS